jgi:hypothetical protein
MSPEELALELLNTHRVAVRLTLYDKFEDVPPWVRADWLGKAHKVLARYTPQTHLLEGVHTEMDRISNWLRAFPDADTSPAQQKLYNRFVELIDIEEKARNEVPIRQAVCMREWIPLVTT